MFVFSQPPLAALARLRREAQGLAIAGKESFMRLDKYLKVSRIIKRRTVANEACDAGRVSVGGKIVKASYEVKPGDVLEIRFGEKVSRYEVLQVEDNVRKNDAALMYRALG
jgi:ribosomal 50S subunit-recycling heat shock protein